MELAPLVVNVAVLIMFGAFWPLAALALFLAYFAIARMDVWKFCRIVQRPLAERWPGLGMFQTALEALIVLGIIVGAFSLSLSSESVQTYVFTNILLTTNVRIFMAFILENACLGLYFVLRFWGIDNLSSFVSDRNSETFRTVREAYQFANRVREHRYALLSKSPRAELRHVVRDLKVSSIYI